MNLVGVDLDGIPMGNEITCSYACNDVSVNQEAESLRRLLGAEKSSRIYQLTGAPIHAAYALAQLRALYNGQKEEPIKSLCTWKTIATICLSRWTGDIHLPISYSEASWTGLLNFETCQYEQAILQLLPPVCQGHLPQLSDFNERRLCLQKTGKYWLRWPQLRSTLFFLGVGDGACANIGSRCATVDKIACTVGTSAAARITVELPVREACEAKLSVPSGLFCYRVNNSHVLVGGALTDGGSVVEWIRKLLRLSCDDEFQTLMAEVKSLVESDYTEDNRQISKGTAKLTVIPFLSGERSTGFRTGATGAIIGLTRDTSNAQLLKCCLESVVLRINAIVQLLQSTVQHLKETGHCAKSNTTIICSGKALEDNEIWRQMLADCEDLDVHLETAAATSRGIAVLVMVSIKNLEFSTYLRQALPLDQADTPVHVTKPNSNMPGVSSYWNRAREMQSKAIECLAPLYGNPSH